MTKNINIQVKKNGYVVTFAEFLKNNGEYVYKFTDELKLVEDVGRALLDKKIEAREK